MRMKINKIKQEASVLYNGLKLSGKYLGKYYLLINTLVYVLRAVTPYITIYCSALVITALTQGKGFNEVFMYVIIAMTSTFVIDIAARLLNRKRLILMRTGFSKHKAMLSRKSLSLNYSKCESSEVQTLRGKVEESADNGNGITWICDCIGDAVSATVSLIVAVTMVSGMFTAKSSASLTGVMKFVDSPVASLIIAAATVALAVITIKFNGTLEKKQFQTMAKRNIFEPVSEYYSKKYLNENESGKDVRIFGEKRLLNEELEEKVYKPLRQLRNELCKIWIYYGSVPRVASNILGSAVYLFVGIKALAGAFGAGKVVEYYGALTKLIAACNDIAGNLIYLSSNTLVLQQELDFYALTSDMVNGTKTANDIDLNNTVFKFCNASFRYPETEPYVLKNFNMKIRAGERIAVVGMNGSGKTTMIKLLCRLYDPTEGCITVNGIDIREFDYCEYLKLFSIVFQDFELLAFPIGENVACSEVYDEEKVWKCLDMAGIKQKVEQFPKKLNQSVYKLYEKDGIDVSGGEEQKLAIARALYKDAPFVILDEPTAALDPIAESEIYSKFNEIIGTKTAVYISHRLSSCRFCSRIIVFDNGELIQEGTHDGLLRDRNGKYAELWNAQAQYYTKDTVQIDA